MQQKHLKAFAKQFIQGIAVAFLVIIVISLYGCTTTKKIDKIAEIEYCIIKEEDQPIEVQELIEQNKETAMKLSYTDQGKEYVIIGYGRKDTSGYSVEIRELYEAENTIYIDTNLLGPSTNEEIATVATYPYIVIQIAENEKPIVYD